MRADTASGGRTAARRLARFRVLLPLALVVALAWGLDRGGAFRPIDHALTGLRMSAFPREAGGDFVLLGIDDRALEEVGTWPWPREIHGEILGRLFQLGATEVFLDVDLSTASNPTSDRMLAEVFDERGAAVILPAFRRLRGLAGEEPGAAFPLEAYRQRSWIASVNVQADRDGIIRTYPWGHTIADQTVPAAASILSGRFGPADTNFHVNFALEPGSIPQYSAADLLTGALDRQRIEGRSVVVGAHATELRDGKAVPVHGTVSGALLHILAAETLAQGIELVPVRHLPVLLLVSSLAVLLARSRLRRRPARLLAALALLSGAVELSALALQAGGQIVVSTPVLHAALAGIAVFVAARELHLRRWLLRLTRTEMDNGRSVLSRIIADSSDAIVVADDGGRVIEVSDHARRLFGIPADTPLGCRCEEILPAEMVRSLYEAIETDLDGRPVQTGPRDLTLPRRDGPLHLEYVVTTSRMNRLPRLSSPTEHSSVFVCMTARDVTELREQHRRLDYLARFDPLTGALNRASFLEHLRSDLGDGDLSVLAFDLQGFETVNLTLGREVGDAILREVPDRVATLGAALSATARLGGGTFCVACPSADPETVRTVASRLRALISAPFDVKGVSALVECRIGIALGGGAELADLLDRAESALDMARQTAGGDVNFFDAGIRERHQRAQNLERALSLAIDNDELHLVYQPQVSISDGRMIGVEALVRWTHPQLGPVSPGEFIPIAENGGFIEPLGRWVLERACHDAASWPAGITVAVNVSPLQFQRTDVVQEVFRSLAVSALDPKRLQIEITETIFAQNQEEICATLKKLKKAGVTCALDDFGSGFSSLGYLATLPLDKLKLDRMFVRGIETDASRATIVRSVLALSRGLGLKFLCEGIETREELEVLRDLGCREAQGYYFARPQSKADVEKSFDTMGVGTKAA